MSAGSGFPTTARRCHFRGIKTGFPDVKSRVLRKFAQIYMFLNFSKLTLRGEDKPARSPRRPIAAQRMWLDVLMKFSYLPWKGGGSQMLRRVCQRGALAAPAAAVHHGIRIQRASACRIKVFHGLSHD